MSDSQLTTKDDKSLSVREEWEHLLAPEAKKMLGTDEAAQSFVRVILTAFNKTPKLMKCSRTSIMAAVMDLAALKLYPNTPQQHAYLIPRKVDDVLTCCVEIGYRGYCELAYRGGMVADIDGNVIHQCDKIEYQEGTDGFVKFTRQLGSGRSQSPVIGCYVVVTMKTGTRHVKVLDSDQLASFKAAMMRANFNKITPAWKYYEDEMYLKSTLKRVGKLLPLGQYVNSAIEIEHRRELVQPEMPMLPERKQHLITFGDEIPTNTEKRVEEEQPSRVESGREAGSGENAKQATLASAAKGLASGDTSASKYVEPKDSDPDLF